MKQRRGSHVRFQMTALALALFVGLSISYASAQSVSQYPTLHLDQVDDLDISSTMKRVATVEHSGRVIVWDWDNGHAEHVFPPEKSVHASPVRIRFINALNALFLMYNDGTMRMWRLDTGNVVKRDTLWEEGYVFGGDATYRSYQLTVLSYSASGHTVYELRDSPVRTSQFAGECYGQDESLFTPDGKRLLIVSDKNPDILYDVETGKVVNKYDFPLQVQAVAFSNDTQLIATGTYVGGVDVWDVQSGQRAAALVRQPVHPRFPSDPGKRVWALSFSADKKLLAAARGKDITVWDVRTGRELGNREMGEIVSAIAFEGDTYRLVAGTRDSPSILRVGKRPMTRDVVKLEDARPQGRSEVQSGPRDSLFEAIVDQDADRVSRLLAQGVDPNLKDEIGATPLWVAAGKGNERIVKELLRAGANVNGRSIKNSTALWNAAQQGRLEIVELLLAARCEVDVQDTFGGTALQWAAYFGHKEIVALLLKNGADVNLRRKSGETAITMARSNGHLDVVRMLEDAGARGKDGGHRE